MIGFDFKLDQFKSGFFDRAAVVRGVDRATRRVLSRFGAFVRTTVRDSMGKRGQKKVSQPGEPPRAKTGLIKRVLFAYEPDNRSVIIGPQKLNVKGGPDIPRVLEEGGQSRNKRRETIFIEPRPYMKPGLDKNLPELPKMWKDSVR